MLSEGAVVSGYFLYLKQGCVSESGASLCFYFLHVVTAGCEKLQSDEAQSGFDPPPSKL